MSKLLLAKPVLPPDFIDVSVGEPYLIKALLLKIFNVQEDLSNLSVDIKDMAYPSPSGYTPLVKLLEEQHGHLLLLLMGLNRL